MPLMRTFCNFLNISVLNRQDIILKTFTNKYRIYMIWMHLPVFETFFNDSFLFALFTCPHSPVLLFLSLFFFLCYGDVPGFDYLLWFFLCRTQANDRRTRTECQIPTRVPRRNMALLVPIIRHISNQVTAIVTSNMPFTSHIVKLVRSQFMSRCL